MTKKWLHSVAMGALLMAGNALGITVHDVFSNGFWSAEQKGTERYLKNETKGYCSGKYIKEKNTENERSYVHIIRSFRHPDIVWKSKQQFTLWSDAVEYGAEIKNNLVAKRTGHKEKIKEFRQYQNSEQFCSGYSTYTDKPRQKDARPIKPLVVDNWFPDTIREYGKVDFYGTEQTAVTNIVSDNEAYITRTIRQTGWIYTFRRRDVNEATSLQRTYDTHITTDDDHVYVDQTLTESGIGLDMYGDPTRDSQADYQSQYVATFKRGCWKGSTETITMTQNSQKADWYIRYRNGDSQNTR